MKLLSALTITTLLSVSAAFASPIYDTFGTLSGATFGGTGISSNAVAITQLAGNAGTIGLTATPRYPNPTIGSPLPNDGAGTFTATPGSGVTPGRATWNFDFYINLASGTFTSSGDSFILTITGPNSVNQTINLNTLYALSTTSQLQDSENLVFASFGGPNFDINAVGTYDISLTGYNAAGAQIGEASINVNVGSVPDASSTAVLLGLGMGGLSLMGFAKSRQQKI